MGDHNDQSDLPPIPDGGLADTMPEWLRRPPAWRTLPDRDVVQPEPVDTSALPEADTSVIDPRTFLSDDDLPPWLRGLGRRGAADTTPAPVPADAVPPASEQPVSDAAVSPPSRFVPISPSRPPVQASPLSGASRGAERRPVPRLTPAPVPWWQRPATVVGLAVLLVAAIIIIVIIAVV